MPVHVVDNVTVEIKTPKLSALFKGPRLVSLADAAGGPWCVTRATKVRRPWR